MSTLILAYKFQHVCGSYMFVIGYDEQRHDMCFVEVFVMQMRGKKLEFIESGEIFGTLISEERPKFDQALNQFAVEPYYTTFSNQYWYTHQLRVF